MDLRATLNVVVDATGARSGVEAAGRAFDMLKRRGEDMVNGIDSAFQKLKDSIFSLKTLVGGLLTGALAKSFIEAGASVEQYTIRLRVMLGSQKEANQLFADLNKFALQSPFAYKDIMEAATAMAGALKGGRKEIEAWMPLMSDLAATAGLSIQDTAGQVIKMLSAGSGAADMFRERGILAMLGFQQGVQYTAKQTREKLIEAFESPVSKFRDASKLLMNTWQGAVSNLEDAWFQFQQRVMVDGGVLQYLEAIVQVLTDDFGSAFGKGSDAAKDMSRNILVGMEYAVRGVGALIQACKFAVVAFNTMRVAASGFSATWAETVKLTAQAEATWANASAEKARIQLERAKQIGDDKYIKRMTENYRQALESAQKANFALSDSYKTLEEVQKDNQSVIDGLFKSYDDFANGLDLDKFLDDVNKKFRENAEEASKDAKSHEKLNSGLRNFAGTVGMTSSELSKFKDNQDQAREIQEKFNKSIMDAAAEQDPVQKAYADFADRVAQLSVEGAKWLQIARQYPQLGYTEAQIRTTVKQAIDNESEARDRNIAKALREVDVIGEYLKKVKQDDALVGLTAREKAIAAATTEIKQAYDALGEGYKKTHPLTQQQINDFQAQVAASYDLQDAYDKTKQVQDDYANTWANMLNGIADSTSKFFTGQIKSWRDFGRALLSDITGLVAAIISQWFKLQFVNPMLNSMFGGTFNLPTMANTAGTMFGGGGMFGGGAGGGGGGFSPMGMATNYVMGGGGNPFSGFSLTNFFGGGSNLATAGPYTYGGVGPYAGTPGGATLGYVPDYYNGAASVGGAAPGAQAAYNPIGGYTNIGGWQASTAGLMGAGVGLSYGLRRGDGGMGTAASGAAGAFGGYAVGAAAGAAGGVLLAGGSAAAAGSAALAAIPVVGWIALAALVIDKISGGKLFGTRWKPKESTTTFSLDADGGSVENKIWETRQGALFSGTKNKDKFIAPTDEQNKAIDDIFKNTTDSMKEAAKRFGVEVPPMIEGSWKTITEYDKKGKKKSEKEISEFNGKIYEESFEDFQKRAMAEGWIAVFQKVTSDASAIAEQFRGNVDKFLEGATMMGAALEDIQKGDGLLGKASKLKDVVDVIVDMQKEGETLSDTYARVSSATKAFNQFLDYTGLAIGKTGKDLVKMATDIADAAGGSDRANALYNSYYQNYYTPEEQQRHTTYGLQTAVMREVGDLGKAGEGLNFDNFRERFEKMLPKLDAAGIKEWLEAGDALAALAHAVGSTHLAVTTAHDAINSYNHVFKDFAENQVDKSKTMNQLLHANVDTLMNQARAYDGTLDSESKLIGMIQDRYAMEMSYLALIKNIQDGINDSIDNQLDALRTSKMTDQGKYEYFKSKADSLSDQLARETDPEKIAKLVAEINQYEQAAYNVLSPEQQQAMADQFIDFFEKLQDEVNHKLDNARTDVQTQNQTISQAVEIALTRIADKQQKAADKQAEAADTFSQAVNTPQQIDVRVTVVDKRDGEVGGIYR